MNNVNENKEVHQTRFKIYYRIHLSSLLCIFKYFCVEILLLFSLFNRPSIFQIIGSNYQKQFHYFILSLITYYYNYTFLFYVERILYFVFFNWFAYFNSGQRQQKYMVHQIIIQEGQKKMFLSKTYQHITLNGYYQNSHSMFLS